MELHDRLILGESQRRKIAGNSSSDVGLSVRMPLLELPLKHFWSSKLCNIMLWPKKPLLKHSFLATEVIA